MRRLAWTFKVTGLWVAVAAPVLPNAQDLKVSLADGAHSGYFDAHTHWPGGILPWKAFVKLLPQYQAAEDQALVDKKLPTQAEYARLSLMYEDLFKTIKDLLAGPLQNSPRVSPGSRAVAAGAIPQPKDPAAPTAAEKTSRFQWLETALGRLLTSSVRTDYDSAYAIRGAIVDRFFAADPGNAARLLDWNLLECALGGITCSEQTTSAWYVSECATPAKMAAGLARIAPALGGRPAPEVRFLIQFTQPMLSQVGEVSRDQWQIVNAGGKAEVVDAKGAVKANADLLARLAVPGTPLAEANVAGVDILSPEKNLVTDQGKANFKQLIRTVFTVARQQGRRLVVRSHCGEGYPISESHGTAPEALDAPVPELTLADNGEPLHYYYAELNVGRLLEAVEECRRDLEKEGSLAAFDDTVNIRFGHVAHATREQAKRMAAARIWADVNLTSNIATGTLYVPRPDLSKPNTVDYFEDHALVQLMAEGVNVLFGSDGPGVEHSYLPNEPGIAQDIFKKAGALKDKDGKVMSADPGGYVDRMLKSSKAYVDWMAGRPGPAR